jgi:hypothetical protein
MKILVRTFSKTNSCVLTSRPYTYIRTRTYNKIPLRCW